jgi:hypothetical protein
MLRSELSPVFRIGLSPTLREEARRYFARVLAGTSYRRLADASYRGFCRDKDFAESKMPVGMLNARDDRLVLRRQSVELLRG